jgi:hypothetical protein
MEPTRKPSRSKWRPFVVVVLVLVGLYLAFKLAYPTYTYRYRITVEVDVRGETKSGASVIEVSLNKQPQFLPHVPSVATTVRGEAVFVDLGDGRNVIALLASGSNVDYPGHIVPHHFKLSYADRDLVKFPQLQDRWDLAGEPLPTLVTFAYLADPNTARMVRPEEFEAVFGQGVRFKRVWIEMVSTGIWPFSSFGWPRSHAGEPVTRRLEAILPWWNGPGRPAAVARRAWLAGQVAGPAMEPETLFIKGK